MDTSYERHRAHLTKVYKKEAPEAGEGLIREQLDYLGQTFDALWTDEEYEQASPEQRDSLVP